MRIQASVIGRPVYPNPVRAVDAAFVVGCRTERKGAGNLDPPAVLFCYGADLISYFGKVLVLAENERHVALIQPDGADDIERDPDINAFFLTNEECMGRSVGKRDGLIPVPQWPGKHFYPLFPHDGQFDRPEMVPEGVVRCIGNACIEMDAVELPSFVAAYSCNKRFYVVIGVGVTKGFFGTIK